MRRESLGTNDRIGASAAKSSAFTINEEASAMSESFCHKRLLVGLLCLVISASAVAQSGPDLEEELNQILAENIATGSLLASDGFAASGRFTFDEELDSTFRVTHFGFRRALNRRGRLTPYLGASAGELRAKEQVDLFGPVLDDFTFKVRRVGVEGGVELGLEAGWFVGLGLKVGYNWAENELTYRSAESEAFAPLLDGFLVNLKVELLTLQGAASVGWRRPFDPNGRRLGMEFLGELATFRTDPTSVDHPRQDRTVSSEFLRLGGKWQFGLGRSIRGRPLRLDAELRQTFLSRELGQPLGSQDFSDVRIALLTLWPENFHWPISAVGVEVSYTRGDGFDGWAIGFTLGD